MNLIIKWERLLKTKDFIEDGLKIFENKTSLTTEWPSMLLFSEHLGRGPIRVTTVEYIKIML